ALSGLLLGWSPRTRGGAPGCIVEPLRGQERPHPPTPHVPFPHCKDSLRGMSASEQVKTEPNTSLRPILFVTRRSGAAFGGTLPTLGAVCVITIHLVPAPFRMPVVHPVEPPCVGYGRRKLVQHRRVISEGVRGTRPRPAGVFPLRFGGQAIPVATENPDV